MVARKYSLVPDHKPAHFKGQCKIVYDALKADTTPRLASEVSAAIADLPTRQDKLRVVLYYILVMKKLGIVRSFENEEKPVESVAEATERVGARETSIILTDGWR